MKLNKEQKQKLALGGMMVLGVIYAYFEFLLGPLQGAKDAAYRSSNALDPKIAQAKAEIAKARELRAKEPEAKLFMDQVNALVPDGSPIAWFPPRMADFFRKHGVDKANTRLNSETVEKEIVGYRRMNWGLECANANFLTFAATVAALENEEPLIEVQSFEIEAGREDVGTQRAALILNHLIRL